MAQFRKDSNTYMNDNKTLFEVPMIASGNGSVVDTTHPFPVTIYGSGGTVPELSIDLGAAAKSAFGELLAITPTPVIQLDALGGINPQDVTTYASGSGANGGVDSNSLMFRVQTGTTSTGDAHILSKKYMKYRPGQGSLSRFTAAFTQGVANSTQLAGLQDTEVALAVGYDGADFGVVRANGGKVAIHRLTITTAPTGTQTATVTLNGVPKTVSITAGTTAQTAVLIAADGVGGYPGWLTESIDNTVIFRSTDPMVTSGSFSFSSTGAGTLATGTFSTVQTGVNQTYHWTKQADFNLDTLDGTGNSRNPSKMDLNPTKLNVYQISFRWLGAGVINYAIEDQITGKIITFHQEHYTNQNSTPHLDNPSFRIGYSATNKGNTTNLTVTGASMMMAIEGVISLSRTAKSRAVDKTSLAKDSLHHMFSLRNSYTFNNKLNAAGLNLKKLSFGFQATDPVTIYLFQDATSMSTPLIFTDVTNSMAKLSTTTATFDLAIDSPCAVFVVGPNGADNVDLMELLISEPPGSIISFAVTSTVAITRGTIAAMWTED